jgi:hypothetical protein
MLLIRNNAPIDFDYGDYEYFKSLKNSRSPDNQSYITIVNFTDEVRDAGVASRDVYHVSELKNDLVLRAIDAMHVDYIRFMIVFCVDPGVPVLSHVHKSDGTFEGHYQPVIGLSPNNDINAVIVNTVPFDMTGHNNILLNVKMPHYVTPQRGPTMWLTSFGARMK